MWGVLGENKGMETIIIIYYMKNYFSTTGKEVTCTGMPRAQVLFQHLSVFLSSGVSGYHLETCFLLE